MSEASDLVTVEPLDPLEPLEPLAALPVPLEPAVVTIAAAGGLSSGAALVVAIVTDRPLWLASTFVFVPGFVAFVALTVMMRRRQQGLFLLRLRRGVIAGVLATGAYDVVRWFVEHFHLTSTNSFVAIRVFGYGLTNQSPDSTLSLVLGWAFHALNGIGFAVAFIFVAAQRPWYFGVAFALVLEAFMVSLYPGWLGVSLSAEFLTVSILGHVAYGSVLGAFAERSP